MVLISREIMDTFANNRNTETEEFDVKEEKIDYPNLCHHDLDMLMKN